ncbi:ABC transporter substrate-binding protein [Cellulomonas bogoriensis]|uniref:Iron ABC transporter substrate-binding protein n=1 Tax=Cellulomonas bogoriensis 69B4 = DSM 16987 TaxID=1386082 RepID=A0A0A0BL90_9CELL|nr:ABC transporter substrate-binding protein [Cellulomonas bogoriensis]KGM08635.1 iron ABC transporter substrate-binding protein [Cellulomonas bogoriensis 69B4 = DSM 16987]
MHARTRPGTRAPHVRVLALAATAALALAACTADPEDPATPGPDPTGDATFPVTIDHALGQAVVPERPERVVTLGWGSHDTVLALGVVPVGIPADSWAGDPETGLLPWTQAAIDELGGEQPTTYTDLPEVNVEQIAGLAPDLILAPYSGISQEVYDQLATLAPTVAYPEQPWLLPWQDQTLLNGRALGMEDQAQELIDQTTGLIEQAAQDNPELAGTTFAYVYATPDGALAAYVEGDPRVDLLTSLGMELAPAIADLDTPEGTFYADLGTEGTDLLEDVDLLLTWYNDTEEQAAVEGLGTFQAIPAVERGTYLPLLDRQLGMAMTTTTALSVPWGLDTFVPQLLQALDQ